MQTHRKRRIVNTSYSMIEKIPHQVRHLNRIIGVSDIDCIVNLRMTRNTFGRLCKLLRELGSLSDCNKLAFLFGEEDVKVENKKVIITISDSTNDDRQKILIHNISEDEDEVLSPLTTKLKNFTKIGDEASGMEMDDESSTNNNWAPHGFMPYPPPGFFPPLFQPSKGKGKAPSGSSSCACQAPTNP